ncbi:hypothetical protein HRbin15_00401 [bacterium HR15]|nr:hypothetical protein HRbin15_00401 [bacterium HR15]
MFENSYGLLEGEAPAEPRLEGEAPTEPSLEGEAPAEPSLEGEAPAEPFLPSGSEKKILRLGRKRKFCTEVSPYTLGGSPSTPLALWERGWG